MVGKPPGTGVVFSTRRSTQRVLYRAVDGTYWEIVYLNGSVNGIMPWHIHEGSPLAAPAPPAPAEPPEELDLAFLLSGSPIKRESLFTDALPGSTEAILALLSAPLCVDPEGLWQRTLSPVETDDPLHCDLHRSQVLPGLALRRSRNTARSYGSYAPPCSGCRIGAEEEAGDAADDAELKECTEWLNLHINYLTDASIAGLPAATIADRRAEVESGMVRLEICDAWSAFGLSRETTGQFITSHEVGGFGDPAAIMRAATTALAADDAAADIRRAMTIIGEAKEILKTATGRLRMTPLGAGYAAYKIAMEFLAANPPTS